MPSSLCANCSTIFTDLQQSEQGCIERKRVVTSPDSCPLCVGIGTGPLCSKGVSYLESAEYKATALSPEACELNTVIQPYWHLPVRTFRVIPSASLELPLTRLCSTDTLCKDSFAFLRSKLNECLETHTTCHYNMPTQDITYPTRLLNLNSGCQSKITLEDTDEETQGHYVTLSHCWGTLQPVKLTQDSERSLRQGMHIADLPKTFQDAIDVCRQLHIAYLWIDSLCIYQDNLTDWHAEAASMRQVYASAVCNIAATGASNASVGLRFERNMLALAPFEVSAPKQFWLRSAKQAPIKYLVCPRDSYLIDIEFAPLNNRAWVMQERLLSRRIMHFTASGVYWECRTNISSDIYPEHLPEWIYFATHNQRDRLLLLEGNGTGASHESNAWNNKRYDAWNRFCENYSYMDMTVDSDKLVAIHGVAQKLSQINGDRLVCGLWEQHLHSQLLWTCVPHFVHPMPPMPLPPRWRAPSWSWASHNVAIQHTAHLDCAFGQAKATVEKLEVDAHASGQLKDATLTLRGRVVESTLEVLTNLETEPPGPARAFRLTCGNNEMQIDEPLIDFHAVTSVPFNEQVLCIGVYEDLCPPAEKNWTPGGPDSWELGVLVLQQCNSDPPRYRRLGVCLLDKGERELYTTLETPNEHSITII